MKNILLPALLCCCLAMQAQENKKYPITFQKAVSFNPLMLIGPDYTLTGGYEYRLRTNLLFSSELGIIMGSSYYSAINSARSAWGFLVRPSVRFFVNEDKSFYIQPQLYYKVVNHRLNDWLGKDCVDDVPAYEELTDFTYRRHAMGFNIIAGRMVPNKAGNVIWDFYLGLGLRHKMTNVAGNERGCYNPAGIMFDAFDEEGTFPNVPAGLRLIFVLGK